MKICDLTQFYSPVSGGVKRYVTEKVRYIRDHTASGEHLLIIPGASDSVETTDRARVYTIRSPLISKTSRYRALLRLDQIERILEAERPDLVECGDPYQVAWKAVRTGAALGIPVVGFYHSHFAEAYLRPARTFVGHHLTELLIDAARRYVRALYNRFAKTLVPSPHLGSLLESWNVRNVVTLDLGVDATIFHAGSSDRHATRAELGVPPDHTLLLYVGRLAPEKNTNTLFSAFQELAAASPAAFHLLVVGDGHDRTPLENLARSLRGSLNTPVSPPPVPGDINHLAPTLSWLPYCGDSLRLARLYRAADLFVHPGVLETFGLVTLEAQACGTPVVGIRGSYMDRIVHCGQSSWASHNSVAALVEAIRESATATRHHDRTLLAGKIAALYAWPRVFAGLFDLYTQVVESYAPLKYE